MILYTYRESGVFLLRSQKFIADGLKTKGGTPYVVQKLKSKGTLHEYPVHSDHRFFIPYGVRDRQ